MTTFTYCEFALIFIYAPLYILSCYFVSHAQHGAVHDLQAQLDDETKNFVYESSRVNTLNAITVSGILLVFKYI